MPSEPDAKLRAVVGDGSVVLEYGSGGSTFVALDKGAAHVTTVESDSAWAARLETALGAAYASDRFSVRHVDVGKTGDWGRPVNRAGSGRYHLYPCAVWDAPEFQQPDVVLIDGRFRTACFVTTLLSTKSPVTILFDDYVSRDNYHWVETLCPVSEIAGRMAVFKAGPTTLTPDMLTRVAGSYADPR